MFTKMLINYKRLQIDFSVPFKSVTRQFEISVCVPEIFSVRNTKKPRQISSLPQFDFQQLSFGVTLRLCDCHVACKSDCHQEKVVFDCYQLSWSNLQVSSFQVRQALFW